MDTSDKLWNELSLVDFSNIELLQVHGYLCISLNHPQTKNISSRDSIKRILQRIFDHLKGVELLTEMDIELLKHHALIFGQ